VTVDWENGVMTSVNHGGTSAAPYDENIDEMVYNPVSDILVGVAHQIGLDFTVHLISPSTGLAYESFTITGPTNTCCLIPGYNDGSTVIAFDAGTNHAWQIPIADSYYGLSVPLDEVVADILDDSDVDSTEYLVTALAEQYVDGVAFFPPKTGREKIDLLRSVYWFDGAESENQIKFAMRGGSSVADIPEDDLAASNGTGPSDKPFIITRGPVEEVPRQVDVHYIRKGAEYEAGVQHDRVMNTDSTGVAEINAPVVLDDFKARDVASVSLYTTRLERTGYAFATSKKYTHIEPMDIVTVTYDGKDRRVMIQPSVPWERFREVRVRLTDGIRGTEKTACRSGSGRPPCFLTVVPHPAAR
jgi:hypothetical protein